MSRNILSQLNAVKVEDFDKNMKFALGYTPADYGLLNGLVYSIPFIICLLFSGTLADRFNRKIFLVISVII